ncbi:MAG: D-aminoacyl-tRNA deacylase [Cytophagaceae bacterium]|jgi:D-tyrosyl-tRNA(Tyr) deacylase|nr:D-aminoacyl-tRNA deacylase [Cytophagaceae bacterium]
MIAVLQRVLSCSLVIEAQEHSSISNGLLVLLGVEQRDSMEDVMYLVKKITQMRIFADAEGKMNLSLKDVDGELMIVSQFTLHASTKKGNRPSFTDAARPEQAKPLYESFIEQCEAEIGKVCKTGVFGADMKISLINDGPVTIIIDSQNKV